MLPSWNERNAFAVADYDAARIYKAPYFKLAPLKRGRSERKPYIIGYDSEAEKGKPFLMQFAHPDGSCDLVNVGLERDAGMGEFFGWIVRNCKDRKVEYVIFGFNLQYEWTQIFHDVPAGVKDAGEFIVNLELDIDDQKVNVMVRTMNNKRYMLTCEIGGTKRRVKLIDAMAYFPMSLDAASAIIGIGAKLPKPEAFTRKAARTDDFVAYAKQDAILTQKLGEYIIDIHETYDVPTCISSPHFAARTFRHHYLSREIPRPHRALEQYGLDSYHGGKNGFYLFKPQFIRNIWHYDIRSAYAESMAKLPNVETGEWIATDHYTPDSHAIYEVTGNYTGCKHHAIMHHATGWVKPGWFANVRVTGYELDAALALGEIEVSQCIGWVFKGEPGGPLKKYVDDFYAMKRNARNLAERATAKLFLTSLYGKFFQKQPLGEVTDYDMVSGEMIRTNPDMPYDYEAGGLYHPPIASLITGFVRGKIHLLEHKYDSIMTSTDGMYARNAPDPNDVGDECGDLEAEIGSLRIWRERLYVFKPYKVSHSATCKDGCKKDHASIAMHGFRGSREQLERMPLRAGSTYNYEATAMVTLKMSLRTFAGLDGQRISASPGEFVTLPFAVKLAKAEGP